MHHFSKKCENFFFLKICYKFEVEKECAYQGEKYCVRDNGAVLRYPKDKTDVTGIAYESWHFRYVGEEAAKYITDNGLALEEFVDMLNY